jgi:hypothetical protein
VTVLYALFFLPALVAAAFLLLRPRRERFVEEAAAVEQNPFDRLEALLEELERGTFDERNAAELETIAERIEAAAVGLRRVA